MFYNMRTIKNCKIRRAIPTPNYNQERICISKHVNQSTYGYCTHMAGSIRMKFKNRKDICV